MSIKDLRKYKIFGIALFDLTVSIIAMIAIFLIAWKIYYPQLDRWKFVLTGILVTIPISITAHLIFGVNTQLNYTLGLSNQPDR